MRRWRRRLLRRREGEDRGSSGQLPDGRDRPPRTAVTSEVIPAPPPVLQRVWRRVAGDGIQPRVPWPQKSATVARHDPAGSGRGGDTCLSVQSHLAGSFRWSRKFWLSLAGRAFALSWGRDVMLYTGGVSFFALLAVLSRHRHPDRLLQGGPLHQSGQRPGGCACRPSAACGPGHLQGGDRAPGQRRRPHQECAEPVRSRRRRLRRPSRFQGLAWPA